MKQYLTSDECNNKIAVYAIIILIASVLLVVNIVAMTCHANSLKQNSNQTIQRHE